MLTRRQGGGFPIPVLEASERKSWRIVGRILEDLLKFWHQFWISTSRAVIIQACHPKFPILQVLELLVFDLPKVANPDFFKFCDDSTEKQ